MIPRLANLLETPLPGGWVEALMESVRETPGGSLKLKDLELTAERKRRRADHNLYVTDKRDVAAICTKIKDSLCNFLGERMEIDDELIEATQPFVDLNPAADVRTVFKIWGADLDLETLAAEYQEVQDFKDIETLRNNPLREKVEFFASSENYTGISKILARILAAKPHSADVERIVSASVCLKSKNRQRLLVDTENLYLYIHCNMPPLTQWDPRPAVLHWLRKREHRVRERTKAEEQEYFSGIFPQATKKYLHDASAQPTETRVSKPKKF